MFRLRALLLFLPLLFAGCPGDITERACVQLDTSNRRVIIRDYQYDRYRFFDVGKFGGVNYLGPGDSIIVFFLYQSVGTLNPNEPEAVAYPNSLDPTSSPDSVLQRFRLIYLGSEYHLIWDISAGSYYIFFPDRVANVQSTTLAYHMVVKKADGSMLTFGDLTDVPLRLQMLKRSNPQPDDGLWDAEWKNVYDLRARHIDYLELNLDVFKGPIGDEFNRMNLNHQNGVYYLRLLGLDSTNSTGARQPDNKIDDDPRILDTLRGLIIFPSRHPFADSTVLAEYIPALYTTGNPIDLRDSSKHFIRVLHYDYDLGHRDIVRGSTHVMVNGEAISSDHYSVDLARGVLGLDYADAYNEGAEVEVCFEYWK